MNRIVSRRIWSDLKQSADRARRRVGAIAYVTNDEFIKFGKGDLLITDATDEAIAAGQTRAWVIHQAFKRGASIFSCPNLHAKVLVLDGLALIGSSNLSSASERILVEGALRTEDPEIVAAALAFIEKIRGQCERVDAAFIQRIKSIPVRRRERRPLPATPPRTKEPIVLAFYKEVMPSDLKKYSRRSNKSKSGGGARDLRVGPDNIFRPILQQMLGEPGDTLSITQGTVCWIDNSGAVSSAMVELWPPTNARSGETRIANFPDVGGWRLGKALFDRERKARRRCYYLLEMDFAGVIWARIMFEREIDNEEPLLNAHVLRQAAAGRARRSVRGAVDLVSGKAYPDRK